MIDVQPDADAWPRLIFQLYLFSLPTAPNRLKQDFTAAAPNRVWLADMTHVGADEGWLYLAVVLDVYSRAVVGWFMAERITRDLVIAALAMAVWRRYPAPGLIAHSVCAISLFVTNKYSHCHPHLIL